MKIGVLGGSFNPPHIGHLLLSVWALSIEELDKVYIVPCYKHPFGKKLLDFEHRLKMCRLTFKDFKKYIRISKIEKRLGKVSRTIDTLNALKNKNISHTFTLIVGSDILKEKDKWYKIDEIERNYGIIFVPRGRKERGMYIPNINSSGIRRKIKAGKDLAGLVLPDVEKYIAKNDLYS